MAKRNLIFYRFQKNNFKVSRDSRYRAWVWAREKKHCSRISINKVSKVHLYLINICEIFHLLTVNGNNKNKFWFQMMLMESFYGLSVRKNIWILWMIQSLSCWTLFIKFWVFFDHLFTFQFQMLYVMTLFWWSCRMNRNCLNFWTKINFQFFVVF